MDVQKNLSGKGNANTDNTGGSAKVVVVFRELAPYMLACLRATAAQSGHELLVLCLPVNPEAPFDFGQQPGLRIVDRSKFSARELEQHIRQAKPDIVFIADWTNKSVLRAAWKLRKDFFLATGFDNHWTGSIKQRLLALGASMVFPRLFRHLFIPGSPQRSFAKKLGFGDHQITEGAYTADTALFESFASAHMPAKEAHFPHRFLCVARYIPAKGLDLLWEAFAEAKAEHPCDWQLWCAGTGPLWDSRVSHPDIRHLGFVQPAEMGAVVAETGVFVLPSNFEPWGVVVHEYAAAGYPLLLSDAVGAASAFLLPEQNGFPFEAGNKAALKACLLRIMKMNDAALVRMAAASRAQAATNSPEIWALRFLNMGKSVSGKH
jgi:glycosyltransferase involved in cell wall biosynthesis